MIANYQGTAAAFAGSLIERGHADSGGAGDGVHRTGRAVRKLHPPDHDSLHTAVRRRRRAARPEAVSTSISTSSAIIGIILLIGIVKKNGIMMVDFALEAERKEHKSATDAIYQASLLRFRPIMMTTMAALLSGIPLAFGSGIGSELRKPLGVAMVGGLLFSQVLTLYTTPVIYIFFDNLGARFSRRRRNGTRERTEAESHEPVSALHRTPGSHHPADDSSRTGRRDRLQRSARLAACRKWIFRPSRWRPRLPGASPDIMASSIATPLERQFGHIAGITEMTSTSTLGTTSITLQFDLSRDINGAARDVEAGINAARTYLPANLPANPTYRKVNPADSPDPGAGPAVRYLRYSGALRRSVHRHLPAHFADLGRRPGHWWWALHYRPCASS